MLLEDIDHAPADVVCYLATTELTIQNVVFVVVPVATTDQEWSVGCTRLL